MGDPAMGGPPRMTDAELARETLRESVLELIELAGGLECFDAALADY